MKNLKKDRRLSAFAASVVFAALPTALTPHVVSAQGMTPEIRDTIHTLFNQHTNVIRNVTLTKDGYVALTESKNAELATILRSHVKQMSDRLQSGRMIRGWDPAFRELVQHYDDITHTVESTPKGLKITVKGTTEAAIKVAQNHARIVSSFAKNGWAEHDVRHPRVADIKSDTIAIETESNESCSTQSCCLTKQAKNKTEEQTSSCKDTACRKCEPEALPTKKQEKTLPNRTTPN